ncbi:MAG: CBS domain-containing protein [Acidobacteriota bacterium]
MADKKGARVKKSFRGSFRQKSLPRGKDRIPGKEGEIMTIAKRPVVTLAVTTPVLEALKMMVKEGFRRMPVVDPGTKKLLGIVTVTDVINYMGGGVKFQIIQRKYNGNFYKAINEPIGSIMTSDVISIRTTAKIHEAMEVMKKHRIGGLPVTDENDRVIAIVTEQDIVRFFSEKIKGTKVAELMSRDVVMESPETPIIDIERKMIQKRFRRLPIVSDGKFIGMATIRSLLRFFGTNQVFRHLQSGNIDQVLQTPVIEVTMKEFPTINPEADVSEAARLMQEKRRGSIPVLENSMLVGIITERDFFKIIDINR